MTDGDADRMPADHGGGDHERRPPTGDVVVVLSYRGRADTQACVESLLQDPSPPRVVVVDNASRDGTPEAIRARWPQVVVLESDRNLGFSGGMNLGVRRALAGGAETVTILNNDTLVPAGTIGRLSRLAREGWAISPVVTYADGRGDWFAGGAIDRRTGLAHHAFGHQLDQQAVTEAGVRRTDVLAGCCVCASVATWRSVGLLDERYFLTFEDSDWSRRAVAAGVPLGVLTTATIRHRVSAAFVGPFTHLGAFYYARNGLLFARDRLGVSPLARLRFVRHHVVPDITGELRAGRVRPAARRALVVSWAIAADLTRRYGPAPHALERRAERWSRSPDRGGRHGQG